MVTWYRPTLLPIDPAGTPDRGYATMRVTSPWGTRDNPLNPGTTSFHNGLDIGNARLGDVVTAVAAGEVVATGYLRLPWSQPSTAWASGNFGGLMVIIAHGTTHVSGYAHLRRALVGPGQRVTAGQHIGEVGESGSAQGRGHLHFYVSNHGAAEIIKAGRLLPNAWTVDPWPLIEPAADAGLPNTALEDPMPKIVERIDNESVVIERKGIPVRKKATTNSGDVYYTTKAVNHPLLGAHAIVEGDPYGADLSKPGLYVEFVGQDSGFFLAYVPAIYVLRRPIAAPSCFTQEQLDSAIAQARALGIEAAAAAAAAVK
jgi:murein DD-endopeptidase MepM/ murein hydrolase activator NlpD